MMSEFQKRHIGNDEGQEKDILKKIGYESLDSLIKEVVPEDIKLEKNIDIDSGITEQEFDKHIEEISSMNKNFKNFIGLGYYGCYLPNVIKRNVLENPSWYSAYTPYQPEISQGRLEAFINFQTIVSDLTSLPLSNASLLDESTSAAESMIMFYNLVKPKDRKKGKNKFFVSNKIFPQTIDVLKTRSSPIDIDLVIGDVNNHSFDDTYFGCILQNPDVEGNYSDYEKLITKLNEQNIKVSIISDILSLSLFKSPGEMGADCSVGSTQRLGISMGNGGPYAGYFSTRKEYKRHLPGRVIGVSKDQSGKIAYRMALQTREQHIKKEKATSNICTAQALLAIISSFYVIYHGKEGIKRISKEIYDKTSSLFYSLSKKYKIITQSYFDTITFEVEKDKMSKIKDIFEKNGLNLRYSENKISISIDEITTWRDITEILGLLDCELLKGIDNVPPHLERRSDFLTDSVFKNYRTETKLMRYIKKLERKDLSLTDSMIPLGSCTMKLNSATELNPISNPNFSDIHPFSPKNQKEGYNFIIEKLGHYLKEITELDGVTFQPNSGAQGEYTGLMLIRKYHLRNQDFDRNICLIPESAHGTNFASAVMAGMKVIKVECDETGDIDIDDLSHKASKYKDQLSSFMITYPSTHGIFEDKIKQMTSLIHSFGGQVYMDGANMNAQVGVTSPDRIGADVCHLNLHKTFSIPHGGGGPGVGPVLVKSHLNEFLPDHFTNRKTNSMGSISSSEFGSSSILVISYAYIKMLGGKGITDSTKQAIMNSNYMKKMLEDDFKILYQTKKGLVGHEFIVDLSQFKEINISVEDITKRLLDYSFHPPTVSFPVPNTMMIEPTESEDKKELDRFIKAMKQIKKEIIDIKENNRDKNSNILKNAPHTIEMITNFSDYYSPGEALFPVEELKENKFYPSVRRIDQAFGDRNLITRCISQEKFDSSL